MKSRAGTIIVTVGLACTVFDGDSAADERVVLESDGWRLVGEYRAPSRSPRDGAPAALLLHRAAGSREEYVALADSLAERGVASLRLDLRACGESDNLGRFEEPFPENLHLLEGTYRDVNVALRWLEARSDVDARRLAAVGASYSGEAIGEALRAGGEPASVYVILSPGSFSDESIGVVDRSGVPWLFIRTSEESAVSREFIDAVFDALERRSRTAELKVIEGEGHATRIFDHHPFVIEEIAEWIAQRLGDARPGEQSSK